MIHSLYVQVTSIMKKKILIVIAMVIAFFSTPMGTVHVNTEDGTKIFRSQNNVARCDMAAFLHRLDNLNQMINLEI